MTCELNTDITMTGTPQELFELLKVIKLFATGKKEQYGKKKNCAYIESVSIEGQYGIYIENCTDEQVAELVSILGNSITVRASGPYGSFESLGEVRLFEAMAQAAPNASFDGTSSGNMGNADTSLHGVLKCGKLYLSDSSLPDEWQIDDMFTEDMLEKLPYDDFCELFKVDQEEYDEDSYTDIYDNGFPDMEFDDFVEECGSSLEKEEYCSAIEKIRNLGVCNYYDYKEKEFRLSDFTYEIVYDPITNEYEEES